MVLEKGGGGCVVFVSLQVLRFKKKKQTKIKSMNRLGGKFYLLQG